MAREQVSNGQRMIRNAEHGDGYPVDVTQFSIGGAIEALIPLKRVYVPEPLAEPEEQ